MKPIIVHSHIYKCAGTSIVFSLKNLFGNKLLLIERTCPSEPFLGGIDIEKLLCNNDSIDAISSHAISCDLPEYIMGRKVINIVLLRNPIDRAKSAYYFNKKILASDTKIQILSKTSESFDEWMSQALNSDYSKSLINFQTRFFLNSLSPSDDIRNSHLHDAKECIMKNNVLIGTVERINESIALWEYNLRKYFPKLDISILEMNTTNNLRKAINSDNLSSETFDNFSKYNFDFELWRFATEKINEEMSNIKNFSAILKDYQKRCRRKNTTHLSRFKVQRRRFKRWLAGCICGR
jgi:hypothetical protein